MIAGRLGKAGMDRFSTATLIGAFQAWRHRRRRARKRLRMLREADLVVLSLGKSGRTWLRAMISHLYHQRHGLAEDELLEFDNLHRRCPAVPRILFTHDLPSDPWNRPGRRPGAEPFAGKRVLLLVRDPRDVAVSMYFHHAKRARPETRARLGLPRDMVKDMRVAAFMLGPEGRLAPYVRTLNGWAARLPAWRDALVVRYEDLHAAPGRELRRVAAFLEGGFTAAEIERAVAFASFASLRAKEAGARLRTGRLGPADPADPDSFKVREGRTGGWRAHLTPEEAALAASVLAGLDPAFGYAPAPHGRIGALLTGS